MIDKLPLLQREKHSNGFRLDFLEAADEKYYPQGISSFRRSWLSKEAPFFAISSVRRRLNYEKRQAKSFHCARAGFSP